MNIILTERLFTVNWPRQQHGGAHCQGLCAHELVCLASSCFDGSMTPIQMLCISMQRLLLSFYVAVSPTL
jgi:hypothetical protein